MTTEAAVALRPTHGEDSWILEDYEWFEDTGEARYEYSRIVAKVLETAVWWTNQPCYPVHEDWDPYVALKAQDVMLI